MCARTWDQGMITSEDIGGVNWGRALMAASSRRKQPGLRLTEYLKPHLSKARYAGQTG
jgi:hypothetical protein